jgi:hypothetical protein
MSDLITITFLNTIISDCESIIVVPEMALKEAGYIKMFTVKDNAHAKHEYHAMAQMAYFQFQDDELEIVDIDSRVSITNGKEHLNLDAGLILYRDQEGAFRVLVHLLQNRKKLLESTYRYCTRWVRLDI